MEEKAISFENLGNDIRKINDNCSMSLNINEIFYGYIGEGIMFAS